MLQGQDPIGVKSKISRLVAPDDAATDAATNGRFLLEAQIENRTPDGTIVIRGTHLELKDGFRRDETSQADGALGSLLKPRDIVQVATIIAQDGPVQAEDGRLIMALLQVDWTFHGGHEDEHGHEGVYRTEWLYRRDKV